MTSLLSLPEQRGEVGNFGLTGKSSLCRIVLVTLPIVVSAIFLLIGSMRVYSSEMTWDLLFNIDGAWRILNGQVPHVDFHTELGSLPFLLTRYGFYFTGLNVLADPVGECFLAVLVYVLSVITVRNRLPLLPGALLSVLCTLTVLVPMTHGDLFGAYSFAMSYNRFGWSISCVLLVLLFIHPIDARVSWTDWGVGLALLILLYYIKVTYFVIGWLAVGVRVAVPLPGTTDRTGWLAVLVGTALFSIAPFNYPYISDIMTAARAGGTRTGLAGYAVKFLDDPEEYGIALAGCLLLTAVPFARPRMRLVQLTYAAFITLSGPVLLSQNSQSHGILTYIVIPFMLYRFLQDLWLDDPKPRQRQFLLTSLVFPALAMLAGGISISHYYYVQVMRASGLSEVRFGNLTYLVVPTDKFKRFDGRSERAVSVAGPVGLRYELTQQEYVDSLQSLSSLISEAQVLDSRPRILTLDRVNALPFILGLPAPKNVDLWWGDAWDGGLVPRHGNQVFTGVDYVAIPHHSTKRETTAHLLSCYGPYLAEHFTEWRSTPDWLILRASKGTPAARDLVSSFASYGVIPCPADIVKAHVPAT